MPIEPGASLRDLAFEVCDALHRQGVVAVLSGGGAATLYSEEQYLSRDLDFIVTYHGGSQSGQALVDLGFALVGQSYRHPATPFFVEFPEGPLSVGDDLITSWDTLVERDRTLHIISPTDSVRDRLAAYLHWNDVNSLEVALAVARKQTIDMGFVEAWCKREGRPERFATFHRRLGL